MISEPIIIISLILIICISITLHEIGHLIVMVNNGIKIKEVSIGIGPKLFNKKRNGTIYSLRLGFLLGAYIMPDDGLDIVKSKYHTQYQKLAIFSIGIIINLIISIIFFVLYKYTISLSGSENIFSVYLSIISEFNWKIALINIMPALFLTDGSKIINTLLYYKFDKKVSNVLNIIFNIIGTVLFIYILNNVC